MHTHWIPQVGVENIRAICQIAPNVARTTYHNIETFEDDRHLETMITFDDAELCWATNLIAEHFGFHTLIKSGAKVVYSYRNEQHAIMRRFNVDDECYR